jgi:TolB-like protein/tetratricopeptide (TPR) repeat protein
MPMLRLPSRLSERKLVQWVLAYVAGAWFLLEVIGFVADAFAWPGALVRAATVFLGIGMFAAIILAWYHGERGQQRTTRTELVLLGATLLIAVGASFRTLSMDAAHPGAAAGWPAAGALDRSIAVLPLTNLSSDSEQDYLSDGLTEDILGELATFGELVVISRASVMQYKGSAAPLQRIASELGVGYVVQGSVRRSGDRVRISALLTDTRTGAQLWAETFDREIVEIFAVQKEIARRVAQAVRPAGVAGTADRPEPRVMRDPEVYTLYLQGRYAWNQRTRESLRSAIDYFNQAIARDSTFALAYAGLADCYGVLGEYIPERLVEAPALQLGAALRAIQLDPTRAEPHTSLAGLHMDAWQWADAERAFLRALQLNPNYVPARHWYSTFLRATGRAEEALRQIEYARQLDPLSPLIGSNLSSVYVLVGDTERAIAVARDLTVLHPHSPVGFGALGYAYLAAGRFDEAAQQYERAISGRGSPYALAGLAQAHAGAGRRDAARRVLQQIEAEWAGTDAGLFAIGGVHAALGDFDATFAALETSYRQRSTQLKHVSWGAFYNPIRSDPRYDDLLTRMGLRPRRARG